VIASLLPPNATTLECNLAQAGISDIPVPLDTLWNGETCPENLLPWLASAVGVEQWDPAWPLAIKRATVQRAMELHRIRGTPAAIRRTLADFGHPDAEILERADSFRHDGTVLRNGIRRRGGGARWATFRVMLKRPVTVELAAQIVERIHSASRLCCHLVGLDYQAVAIRHNGQTTRNGQYTRGVLADGTFNPIG
jgi:phage tail P2-like protein